MGVLQQTVNWLRRAVEGEPRPGPWHLPYSGGWLPADVGSSWNWWQMGFDPVYRSSQSAMVEACISAYAQTVAMCPGDHWRRLKNGGRERVTTSSLSRLLRHPNDYQSVSDFLLNLTRSLYLDGNAYALALRNDRFEIDELHLMDPAMSKPDVVPSTGDIFYRLAGNNVINARLANLGTARSAEQLIVPQRDVLHVRLHTLERTAWPYPLIGETPLTAAYRDIDLYEKMAGQHEQYMQNRATPSAVLSTDLHLDATQVQGLRDRWNEQSKGLHSGGVPILTHGLKVLPWAAPTAARDLQLAELLKLTDHHIALVFRVPLAILGVAGASGGTTEQLYSFWLASGLGFCLNHIEEAFGVLFDLKGVPDDYVEFNTEALLRSAQKDRIDMLVRGVQGGIFSPNEARSMEDMPEVKYGNEPRLQAQVVPLSAAAGISSVPSQPAATSQSGASSAAQSGTTSQLIAPLPKSLAIRDAEKEYLIRDLYKAADEYDRRIA